MADTKKFCIHSNGLGYCDILSDDKTRQYCVGGPCPHEKIVEYAPVKHGRWVYDEHEMEYSCSECLISAPIGMSSYILHKYCPNCGARMDGR